MNRSEKSTMANVTAIEWTQATWNPIRGCSCISPGCAKCYAMGIAARFGKPGLPFEGFNGILLNWYDGALGHYSGKHRDSWANMIDGAPIVTISLGDERVFRLRPWRSAGTPIDFAAVSGAVFIMPYETNLAWTHEVPKSARHTGRRISVTLRAFKND